MKKDLATISRPSRLSFRLPRISLCIVHSALCIALAATAARAAVSERPAYFVEWLGGDGNQKLDTEYVFKTDPRVETTMMLLSNADKDVAGMPAANASCFIIDYKDSGKIIYYRYHASGYTAVNYSANIQNQWVDVVWGSEVRHNGTLLKSFTTQNFSDNTAKFYLFYARSGMAGLRFKRVRMYDGGTLVRDLRPAVRSNGTACMYDSVTDKCYLNSGTGAFSVGDRTESSLTVEGSPYGVGQVSPPYGFHEYAMTIGTATNCSAPATVSAEGLSATCAGYRFYRWSANDSDWALESSGAGNSLSFTPTLADARVVWLWNVVADLAVSLDGTPSATGSTISIPVNVGGLGTQGAPADLKVAWGYSADNLACTNAIGTVSTLGVTNAVLTRLTPGTAYYVQAVLATTDGSGATAASEVVCVQTSPTPDSRLPDGYTELEYIRTTGAQYIDTGLYPSRALRVEETLSTTDTGTDKMTFGVRNAGYNFLLWFGKTAGTSANPCIGSSGNIGNKSTGKTSGQKWTLYMGPGGVYADNTALYTESGLSSYITTGRSSLPLLLFGLSNNGSIDSRKYIGNCYSFKAYENDVLVRDYVPARRDLDGVVGLYDLAQGAFRTSATATAFVAGPVATLPLTATETVENGALTSVSIDFAADGSNPRTLVAAWGPVHGGSDPAGWYATNAVATIAADATNYIWSAAADWGSDTNLVVRFYFDGEPVQWSNAIFWHSYSAPSVTDVALDGTGGDTLVVSGTLDSFPGDSCTLAVYTGDSPTTMTNAWTGLAGGVLSATGEFALTLHEPDTASPRYIAPGSTVYATVQAVSGGQISLSPAVAVAMKAAPVFASSSASTITRRTVTFTGRFSDPGMAGAASVTLYAGPSTAAEEDLVAVEPAVTVAGTSSFTVTHTFPAVGTTYKWQLRAVATSAGATATRETRTAVASVGTLDTTTYTWKTSVASGNWSDPANWTDNQGGDCLGYPKTADATAVFPADTDANVVFTEKLTIGSLNLAAGPTVTFSQGGASTNATKLTANTMTWHNNSSSGGTITLDSVAIASTSGDTLIDIRRALRLVNGSNLHFAGVFGQQALNTVVVADGSYLSCNGTYFGGGTLVISNATFWTRSHDYVGRNRTGGHVVFQGDHPLWYHANKDGYFYSVIANANVQLDFLVPAGGYASAPLRAISTQAYYMGNNKSSDGSCALTVNVLDESPANFVDGTVTTRLISWPKGINTNMVLAGHLPAYGAMTDDAFVWGSGTYPTTLDVTINGSSHEAQLQVSCEPALVVSDTLDPAIGYTPLASGATTDCAVPSGYVYVSENTRALCTGWKLYDVDPDTLARTLADSGATTNCTVTGNGGWQDLEWQWHVEYLVTAAGAGGTYEPASQWVAHGGTATVTATPDAGLYLHAWTTTGPDAVPASASASFTVTGPAALTAQYLNCFWVAPDGDNANDGLTRATAKATLSAAVALVSSSIVGEKVVIADGIYTNMPAASISKPCIVESEHGAGATKFYIAASGTSISVNHADAVLRGITLCSDRKTNVGKTILSVYAGVAKECVVSNIYESSDHPTYLGGGTMEDCTFIHMTASGKPGALRMGYQSANVVRNCRFIGNVTESGGTYGTISLGGGAIYNSLMYCNTNNSSGPSAVSHDAGTIDSCTIADNYTKGSYAPSVWSGSGKVTRNTLFFGNRNPYGALDARGSGTYSYCAYGSEVPSGTGNIRLGCDPFANRAAGDYRVLAGPTINAGSSQTWMTGAKDLFGNARVIGSKPDIGCHEASVGAFAVVATAPSSFAVGGDAAITFTAAPSGTNLTGIAYGWLVTDQNGATVASVSGDTTGTLTLPSGYGIFTVSLTAVNAAGETAAWSGTATRAPSTMYVAKDSTPTFPYDTWETAADTLPTLVPWCGDGTTVIIGDGVYTNTKASVFLNGTTVRSLHGAESTAIFSKTATTTLILGNPRARVEGLTLFSDHVSRGMAAMTIQSGTFVDGVVSNFYSSSAQIINLIGQSAILTNSTIIRNETTGRINTIHTNTDGSGSGGGKILNCRIVGNVGNNDTYGCAVFNYNGSLTMRNCLIACNTNRSTGASAVWLKSGSVENCTVAENYVGGSSTRAGFVVENSPPVRNCVIHDNRNTANVANWSGTSASYTYCCTTPLPSGAGNVLAVDPLFADGEWRTGAGPCKDAGANQSWMAGATDLDGGDRIVDDTVDIGCYEYFAGALECSAIPSATFLVGEGEVTLAASVIGPDTTGLAFTWLVTDQTGATIASVANSAAATNLVLTLDIGIYDVSLTVRNARGAEASFAVEGLVTVKPQTVYVANGAAQVFPYTTHGNAFTNILDAVDFAESGMRVVIADGTYTNTANITVSKHVVIESEHGAEKTTIFVDNTRFTSWMLNASGSALRNVTLLSDNAGGRTPTTSNQRLGAVRVYSGTLDGCVITNWYVYYTSVFSVSGTRGVATNCTVVGCRTYYRTYFSDVSSGGTLTHCRYLRNNSNNGSYSYGSILRVQGSSSNVRNCLFAENTIGSGTDLPEASVVYLADGTVENCTIAGNAATDSATAPAAYAAAGTFRNNIVWGNTNKAGATDCTAASASSITYCCAPGLAGTGCKAADPCFRGDYTLGSLSPCIDAGLNRAWMDGATDLGGNPRIHRGSARGTVDMGCFESPGASGTIIIMR